MGLQSIAWSLLIFWTCVHVVFRWVSNRKADVLPGLYDARDATERVRTGCGTIPVSVSLHKHVHLSIETTAFNATHASLAFALAGRRKVGLQRYLRLFYNAGIAVCVLGLAIALGLLILTDYQILSRLFGLLKPAEEPALARLSKRSGEAMVDVDGFDSYFAINPIASVSFCDLVVASSTVSLCRFRV